MVRQAKPDSNWRNERKITVKEKVMQGKSHAGNPHVWFDVGEVASAATPRRGSLLYKKLEIGKIGTGNTSTLATFITSP